MDCCCSAASGSCRQSVITTLITYGLNILQAIAQGQQKMTFNLTHPGMAYGRVTLPEVETLIHTLPANVVVWERA